MGFPVSFPSTTAEVVAELLELAAADQVTRFRLAAEREPAAVHFSGHWYGRCPLSSRMTLLRRTPLMIAAAFGSLNVLRFILSLSGESDVDLRCGPDAVTALHCAAAGGAPSAPLAAALLLIAGADPNSLDAAGRRPLDLIPSSPFLSSLDLEAVLTTPPSSPQEKKNFSHPIRIDASVPDIKSSIYASDEFRMFAFKIKPCPRAYSHDWTECPFVHPGENARRRDPRLYNYGCTPCVEFRRGVCPKGDLCEYAHGVFECWLHPAQYRTRLCKDGGSCGRRVCFFAHSADDLRALPSAGLVVSRSADCFADNLSPMSGRQQRRQSVVSPRGWSSWQCVSSPRWVSPRGVGVASPSSGLGGSERGRIELQFQEQEQQMRRRSTGFSANMRRDCENVKQELVGIEPDLSWVQSLVGKNEVGKGGCLGDGKALGSAIDEEHAILGAWLEQMKLDHKVVL